jgi:hypothetical protein
VWCQAQFSQDDEQVVGCRCLRTFDAVEALPQVVQRGLRVHRSDLKHDPAPGSGVQGEQEVLDHADVVGNMMRHRDVMGRDLTSDVRPPPGHGQAGDRPLAADPDEQLDHGGIGVHTGDRSGRWDKRETGRAAGAADIQDPSARLERLPGGGR